MTDATIHTNSGSTYRIADGVCHVKRYPSHPLGFLQTFPCAGFITRDGGYVTILDKWGKPYIHTSQVTAIRVALPA